MKRLIMLPALLFCIFLHADYSHADIDNGKKIFSEQRCRQCHYTSESEREKNIEEQMSKKGPELWYAGSKFQMEWLLSWLQNPEVIRPLEYNSLKKENPGNHPKLSLEEAKAVTDYLASLKSDKVKAVDIVPNKRNNKGKQIFSNKMACSGCHQFPKRNKVSGGLTGPRLVGSNKRLQSDWIYAYLMDMKHFKPVTMMPVFSGMLTDKEVREVTAFIMNDFK